MNEFISAVKYIVKQAWQRIWVCLAIVAIMLTMHIEPAMSVTDTTQGEWHGVTVHPAIVAASKVPQGVTAQVELTMNFPASHGWGVPIPPPVAVKKVYTNPVVSSETHQTFTQQWYQAPRHIRFASDGEYYADAWSVAVIIQTMQDGSYKVLTNEPDVSFTVKSAVAVKDKKRWIRPAFMGSLDSNGSISIGAGGRWWNTVDTIAYYRLQNNLLGINLTVAP